MALLQQAAEGGYTPAQTAPARNLDVIERNDEVTRRYPFMTGRMDLAGLTGFAGDEDAEMKPLRDGLPMRRLTGPGHAVAMLHPRLHPISAMPHYRGRRIRRQAIDGRPDTKPRKRRARPGDKRNARR